VDMMLARACSIAIAVMAGCWLEPPDESVVSSEIGCTGFGCNGNSPVIAGVPFWEAHRTAVNPQGFRIVGFKSATGVPYQIDVREARLVGLDGSGAIALDTPDIDNAVITMLDGLGRTWDVVVASHSSMPYWVNPPGAVTTYHLRVRVPPNMGIQDYDLCSNPPAPGEWPGVRFHAILFEGDRYRPVEKVVSAIGPAAAGWFNIACAGTVPAKLHLLRHTQSSANPALPPPTQAQRQALLRAYAAAVCWGKDSYTGQGELLNVFDKNGVIPGTIDFMKVEGLWDDTHAICIGEQRLVVPNSMSLQAAWNLRQQLAIDCPAVPSCSVFPDLAQTWRQRGLVLTTNP
jgi:hypothetical protein